MMKSTKENKGTSLTKGERITMVAIKIVMYSTIILAAASSVFAR